MKFLDIPKNNLIWEPACGKGYMSEAIKSMGYEVMSSDLNDFGYGDTGKDFLTSENFDSNWIITNPPFSRSEEFIHKCIKYEVPFALLLKSQYWHSKKRIEVFNNHKPKYVLPLTWRPDFLFGSKSGSPTMECIWTVWDSQPAQTTEYILLEKPKLN